jgi:hypothetical protein
MTFTLIGFRTEKPSVMSVSVHAEVKHLIVGRECAERARGGKLLPGVDRHDVMLWPQPNRVLEERRKVANCQK